MDVTGEKQVGNHNSLSEDTQGFNRRTHIMAYLSRARTLIVPRLFPPEVQHFNPSCRKGILLDNDWRKTSNGVHVTLTGKPQYGDRRMHMLIGADQFTHPFNDARGGQAQ